LDKEAEEIALPTDEMNKKIAEEKSNDTSANAS